MTIVLLVVLSAAPSLEPKPFDARIDEAQRLRSSGRRDEALALLETVEAEAKKKKDAVSIGRALQKRGDVQLDQHDCEAAKASYEAAAKALTKADPIACAQAWNDLGLWAKRCGTPDVQKDAFGKALAIYEKKKHWKGIRLEANNLGSAIFVGGDVAGALPYFKKAAAAAKKLGDDEGWLTVQANVALMELLLSESKLGKQCTEFGAAEKKDAGFQRARAAFKEAAQVSVRAGGTALSVCAKFGANDSPRCEPCLVE